MLDEMIERWGLPSLPVAADSGYGDCTLFRLRVGRAGGLRYAVQVDPNATAHPRRRCPGHCALHRPRPTTQARLSRPAGHIQGPRAGCRPSRGAAGDVAPRQPPQQEQPGRGDALAFPADTDPPGQPRHPRAADGTLPEEWLLAEWPSTSNAARCKAWKNPNPAHSVNRRCAVGVEIPNEVGSASHAHPDCNTYKIAASATRSSMRRRPPP